MKKLLLLTAFMFISFISFSQDIKVEVGLGASRYRGDFDGDFKFAWQTGVGYEIPLSGPISIMPSLYIAKKGSKGNFSNTIEYTKVNSNAYYFEHDAMALYRIVLPEAKINIVPQLGLYFAYGFSGKTKISEGDTMEFFSEKVDTFSHDNLKESDFGLAFKVDLEWYDYTFGIKYGLGLKDLAHQGGSVKNSTILFTAGIRF